MNHTELQRRADAIDPFMSAPPGAGLFLQVKRADGTLIYEVQLTTDNFTRRASSVFELGYREVFFSRYYRRGGLNTDDVKLPGGGEVIALITRPRQPG